MTGEMQRFEQLHREVTKVRNIERITIGGRTIPTWYYSPYPPPFHGMDHLFICDRCLRYFPTEKDLTNHAADEMEQRPPGREIYRKGDISIFELYGQAQKITCQCMCLLSKLFLDHKTLFYDVEGFVFYILCHCDHDGAHVAAYFSRELASDDSNILACIVVLPPYQKNGYGRLLISLSYEIAKRQRVIGGPERPLSDLGRRAFRSYWRETLLDLLRARAKAIQSLDELEKITSIQTDDIVDVLRDIQCVVYVKGEYELSINKEALATAISSLDATKRRSVIDPLFLIWMPTEDDARSAA
jgi:histone acetyltransferase MYST1